MKRNQKDKFASEETGKSNNYERGRVQKASSRKNSQLEKQKDTLAYAPSTLAPAPKPFNNSNKAKKEKHALALAPPSMPTPPPKAPSNRAKKEKHVLSLAPSSHRAHLAKEDEQPGAFDIRPGGFVRPAGEASNRSILVEEEGTVEKEPHLSYKSNDETLVSIPNATLVEEEEDFDSRVRKMFKGAVAVQVVDPGDDDQEKQIFWTKKRIGVAICLIVLLLIIIIVPSVMLTQEDKKQTTETSIPTIQPSAAPTSTESILLYMKLGESSNVGFDLSCGDRADDVIERRKAPAFFSKPNSIVTDVYNRVPVGRQCEVKVTNTDGSGLEPEGFLRIHQGAGIEGDILLEMRGNFTKEKSAYFEVGVLESKGPSLAPSMTPSATPSLSLPPSVVSYPAPVDYDDGTYSPSLARTYSPVSYVYRPTRPPQALTFPTGSPLIFPPQAPESPSPTEAPNTPPPTYASLSVVIDILLDNFPIETGWNLTCGSNIKANFPPETYFAQNLNIVQSFSISYDEPCTFFIEDTVGDGICCSNGQGQYTITILGDDSSVTSIPTPLLSFNNTGKFGAGSQETFECTYEGCKDI